MKTLAIFIVLVLSSVAFAKHRVKVVYVYPQRFIYNQRHFNPYYHQNPYYLPPVYSQPVMIYNPYYKASK